MIKILKDIMQKRMASRVTYNDMLEHLLRDGDAKYKLDDEEIIDQIITILYSGYETVSTTSMMALKYLNDNPEALQELRVMMHFLFYVFSLVCDIMCIYILHLILFIISPG